MTVHRPRVFLSYFWGDVPYKWRGKCDCGWACMSWQWQRDDGSGAFSMALDHARTGKL